MMVLSDWCQFAFEDGLFRLFSPPSHLQLLDGPSTIVLPLAVDLLLASLAQKHRALLTSGSSQDHVRVLRAGSNSGDPARVTGEGSLESERFTHDV
jgi:hypothetical protein